MTAVPSDSKSGLRREGRYLIAALVVLLFALLAATLAFASSLLRLNVRAGSARMAAEQASVLAERTTGRARDEGLERLRREQSIARIEVVSPGKSATASGELPGESEVVSHEIRGTLVVLYYEPLVLFGGREGTLTVAALVGLMVIAGLLILIVYLPKFLRPVDQMLAHAQEINERGDVDDDARYLVQTFRSAVERVQRQASEIEHLREAASSQTPDLGEIMRTVERNFQSGLIAIDATGEVLSVNDAGRQILRLPSDVSPSRITDFGESEFTEAVLRSFESKVGVNRIEVALSSSDVIVGCTTVPLFDESHYLGMLVLFVDVTAARGMELRLRDMESLVALGQMSAGIAHEFRNSLFAILGYLKLARQTDGNDPTPRIRAAEEEAKRLAGVVDALLRFTRPLEVRAHPVSIDALTRDVIARFSEECQDVHFSFLTAEGVIVEGDADLLERAIENILRNAVDAVREQHPTGGGRVEAEVTASPAPAIVIRDNGIGLDPDKAATLMLPFQSGKPHGIGLGLPLARKIVLQHGGTIRIVGQPGEGAEVRIEFPMGGSGGT